MADDQKGPEDVVAEARDRIATREDEDRRDEALDGEDWSSPSNLWQIPAILISAVLIALGLYAASQRAPQNDYDGALDQIDRLILQGDHDLARSQLRDVIEPNLQEASPAQQARYHRAVGDWVAASQVDGGVNMPTANRAIDQSYTDARTLGAAFDPARLERWAIALIELREADRARDLIDELEALGLTDAGGMDARQRRNGLLKRLVMASLDCGDLPHSEMMATLEGFAEDPMLTAADEAWVIARQAEMRLDTGEAVEAVDHLLVGMRRLEREEATLEGAIWGELYTLLGQGYFDQGLFDHAEFHLAEALNRLASHDAKRGEALVMLGRVDLAGGDLEHALEHFDEAVREYPGARAELPGLLGRAQVHGILGEHAAGLEDYQAVVEALAGAAPRRDVTPRAVAAALADRHDAAITMGDLPLALEYVSLAEGLFAPGKTPTDVLFRIASTSRQIADDLLADALANRDTGPRQMDMIDPAVRYEANKTYERAGDYFLRHARALVAEIDSDDAWAESLWLAGDSYDRAGRRRQAIAHFTEYVAGRASDDPHQAEVKFRLAQAYQAEMEYEDAIRYFQQVIDEHPRSPFGTKSHVPLARCYLTMDRRPEAERQLLEVVENRQGDRSPITPEAMDYRDALLELGKLYYDGGQYKEAIERLSPAEERYRDDDRISAVRFRLADSYRRRALALREEAEATPNMPAADRVGLERMAEQHMEEALDLFAQVCAGYAEVDESRLDRLQRDCLRFAWLYRGDCAMALGRYEEAASLYDQAARRYADHHASMHALVQIYNCFHLLGDATRAEAAHRRALDRLARLPDEAFSDAQALMDRTAWEQWLKNRPLGLAGDAPPE